MFDERELHKLASRPTPGSKPAFNVAIAYKEGVGPDGALDLLGTLIQEFSDEFEFYCDLWEFHGLESSQMREAAFCSGRLAHLLVISTWCGADLPQPVKEWVDQSLAVKVPGAVGLVGLLESPDPSRHAHCPTCDFLERTAERYSMDCFLRRLALPSPPAGVVPQGQPREVDGHSLPCEGIPDRGRTSRRWGMRG